MRLGHRGIECALVALFAALLLALPAAASAGRTDYRPAHLRGAKAIAPKAAPKYVKKMIKAGNRIRDKRYKWGGGHGDWKDKGYDCSGAVSFVLHKAGLLDYPLTSGGFEKWGEAGRSKWVTIYANKGHVFMVVAGLRWDTSYITDGDKSGPGWSEYMRDDTRRFRIRHPDGSRNW
jgi:cell wall-associated NlpC family hydrolase